VKLQQILFSQGFGTRRQCDALIDSGAVSAAGQVLRSASADTQACGLRVLA